MKLRMMALKQGYIDHDNKKIIDDFYKKNRGFREKYDYYYRVQGNNPWNGNNMAKKMHY